jgi:hypothetical protein
MVWYAIGSKRYQLVCLSYVDPEAQDGVVNASKGAAATATSSQTTRSSDDQESIEEISVHEMDRNNEDGVAPMICTKAILPTTPTTSSSSSTELSSSLPSSSSSSIPIWLQTWPSKLLFDEISNYISVRWHATDPCTLVTIHGSCYSRDHDTTTKEEIDLLQSNDENIMQTWSLPSRDIDRAIWMNAISNDARVLLAPLAAIVFDYFDC